MTPEQEREKLKAEEQAFREYEKKEWGDVYWGWKKKGVPPEEAAFRADEYMRRAERR